MGYTCAINRRAYKPDKIKPMSEESRPPQEQPQGNEEAQPTSAPQPTSPPPMPAPPSAPSPVKKDPERPGLSRIELISLLIGVLGLILAFFQIVPEETRNQLFGFSEQTATATATPEPTITPTPTQVVISDADVGIAVSYFVTPPEQTIPDEQARSLVDGVYARLVDEFDAFADQIDLGVAFLSPNTVPRVEGRTRAIREASARALADEVGADIVLYGEISRAANGSLVVQPEFYVAPDVFSDALELTGSYRLGSAISLSDSVENAEELLNTNRVLSGRTTAAAQIFAGLVLYITENYQLAARAFEQAGAQRGWEETQGREVLNILMGNTYGKQSSAAAQTGETERAREQISLAREEYQEAVNVNAEYARAYTGLATTYYLEWNLDLQETGVSNQQLLLTALDLLEQANNAIDQPEEAAVLTKPIFSRMQITFALWTYHVDDYTTDELDELYRDFRAASEQVIRRYDGGRNPSLQEMASETYALRGLALYAQSLCPQASEEFIAALDLAVSNLRGMFFAGWLGDCYKLMNQDNDAINAYQRAIDAALALTDPPLDQIERYQDEIDELRANG